MTETLPIAPWRVFAATVHAVRRLSPSFVRVTFTGADLDRFADNGYDQRIKLALPLAGQRGATLPDGADWYAQWRALPEHLRSPIRTYTVRAVRPHLAEVDIDLVLHGDSGPATRWAGGPASATRSPWSGRTPATTATTAGSSFDRRPGVGLLLAGDETAVPAISSIWRDCPWTPEARSCWRCRTRPTCCRWSRRRRRGPTGWPGAPTGTAADWCPASPPRPGSLLATGAPTAAQHVPDVDVDTEIAVGGARGGGPGAALRVAGRGGRRHPQPAPAPGRRAGSGPAGGRLHGVSRLGQADLA